MITIYERDDLLHIMKMNRFFLKDSDTAYMNFAHKVLGKDYEISILVLENLPSSTIKENGVIK